MFAPKGSFSSFTRAQRGRRAGQDLRRSQPAHGRQGHCRGMGPDIAWFKDPAGNVISVINPGSANPDSAAP